MLRSYVAVMKWDLSLLKHLFLFISFQKNGSFHDKNADESDIAT